MKRFILAFIAVIIFAAFSFGFSVKQEKATITVLTNSKMLHITDNDGNILADFEIDDRLEMTLIKKEKH
jgi:hypothetical protein